MVVVVYFLLGVALCFAIVVIVQCLCRFNHKDNGNNDNNRRNDYGDLPDNDNGIREQNPEIRIQLIEQRNRDLNQLENIFNQNVEPIDEEINRLENNVNENPLRCHNLQNINGYNNFLDEKILESENFITNNQIPIDTDKHKFEEYHCCNEFNSMARKERLILYYSFDIKSFYETHYSSSDGIYYMNGSDERTPDFERIKELSNQLKEPFVSIQNEIKREKKNLMKKKKK